VAAAWVVVRGKRKKKAAEAEAETEAMEDEP
jgi:hypothetical protein